MKHRNALHFVLFIPLCCALLSCGKQADTAEGNSILSPSGTASLPPTLYPTPTAHAQAPDDQTASPAVTGADIPSPTDVLTPSLAPVLTPTLTPTPKMPDVSAPPPIPTNETPTAPTPSFLLTNEAPTPSASPTPTINATPTNTPTPKPTAPTATPIPPPLLDPKISYLGIAVDGGEVTVWVSKDPAHPQVVVRKRGGNYYSFDWDYNLEYGSPVAYIPKDPMELRELGLPDSEEVLAIWLPTAPLDEPIGPEYIGINREIREICGEGHCLSLTALSDAASGTLQDILIDSSVNVKIHGAFTSGYAKSQDTTFWKDIELFSIFSEDGTILKQYPMLRLSADAEYPVIYSDVHVNEFGAVRQKFGVSIDGTPLWLGSYADGRIHFSDEYIFRLDARYAPYLYPWTPRKVADEGETAWLDLDGDGTPEQICWHEEGTGNSKGLRMSVDGTEYEIPDPEWDLYSPVFTLSLDGETNLLAVAEYAYSVLSSFKVFGYKNQEIYDVGEFSLSYRKIEEGENNVYISSHYSYPLQHDYFWMVKKLENGTLQDIPQDYYEFIREPNRADSHTLSVRRSIDLYREKDGTGTFLLPEGSHAMTLGTDLKN